MSESLRSVATNVWIHELEDLYFFTFLTNLLGLNCSHFADKKNWGLARAEVG